MSESYRALSTDFFVNQKLNLKLDLPRERQTILDMFDRVRRQFTSMNQFKRYRDELALESESNSAEHRWVAIRNNNIRSGSVNPESLSEAYALHQHLLEVAPYFMSISPLDIDFIELLYGFDLAAAGNHDEIVFDALIADTPLGRLMDIPGAMPIDCQPLFGVMLRDAGDIEANFEIKTRSSGRQGRADGGHGGDPISVYLTLRKYGPVDDVKELPVILRNLAAQGEALLDARVVPSMVVPIRDAITSGNH